MPTNAYFLRISIREHEEETLFYHRNTSRHFLMVDYHSKFTPLAYFCTAMNREKSRLCANQKAGIRHAVSPSHSSNSRLFRLVLENICIKFNPLNVEYLYGMDALLSYTCIVYDRKKMVAIDERMA